MSKCTFYRVPRFNKLKSLPLIRSSFFLGGFFRNHGSFRICLFFKISRVIRRCIPGPQPSNCFPERRCDVRKTLQEDFVDDLSRIIAIRFQIKADLYSHNLVIYEMKTTVSNPINSVFVDLSPDMVASTFKSEPYIA